MGRSPKTTRKQKLGRAPSGCGIVFLIALASAMLLVLNGILVSGTIAMLGAQLPAVLRNPKIMQGIVFVGPVLLLLLEWRLIRALLERLDVLFRKQSETPGRRP